MVESGPGMVILLVVFYGFYRLMLNLGTRVGIKIIGAIERPTEALAKQADALTRQSASMDRLTTAMDEYVSRDRSEHREIIMLQKVILDRLEAMRDG